MKSSELNTPISVFVKLDNPNENWQRKYYGLLGMDWGKVVWLETIKDNETETTKSHDSAFAIARLEFRHQPLYIEHTSINLYEFGGQYYEAVGMPTIRPLEGVVYINVKTRDDLGEILIE